MTKDYTPKTPLTHPANRRVYSLDATPSGYAPLLYRHEQGKFIGTEKYVDGETIL